MKDINIPVNILSASMIALNESKQELNEHLQIAIAIMLFQEGNLTLGKSIQLSGLSRYEYEKELTKREIDIAVIDIEQISEDVEAL